MKMWIKRLHLTNFRNYNAAEIDLHPKLDIFVGHNAQGKTNLLEAMYILAMSKSYRTGREEELIFHSEASALIRGRVERNADVDLTVAVSRSSPKKLLVNDKATNPSKFVGRLNVVLFTPDSLQLIKGSPGDRRRVLDVQICQTDAVYRSNLLKYQRVVRQRNQLLKNAAASRAALKQLPIWNEQLADLASRIMASRENVVKRLSSLAAEIHNRLTGERESLHIAYLPFSKAHSARSSHESSLDYHRLMLAELQNQYLLEIQRGYTLVGPHRDDLLFTIDGRDAKTYASQGQQRTAVLSYKLAEMELMRLETGEYPVVLLDDVMSELDRQRRAFLVEILNKKAQTIITTTHQGSFSDEILADAAIFGIEAGRIAERGNGDVSALRQ